jgi:hypothetical protein
MILTKKRKASELEEDTLPLKSGLDQKERGEEDS